MNLTELRAAVGEMAERASQAKGTPARADIASAQNLWAQRKNHLSDQIPSNLAVKYRIENEKNWDSWPGIAESFVAYHAAIVELQNRMATPLAEVRLRGV